MTVYENLKSMLKDAEEILAMMLAKGDTARAAKWAKTVEKHRAELAKYA